MGDLKNPEILREKMAVFRSARTDRLGTRAAASDPDEVLRTYLEFGSVLEPYITDTLDLIHRRLAVGDAILFEGAQGTLLDLDYGTYPFVTSSNSTAGGACTGAGIGPARIDGVLGVFKAYCSRVGSGPFPTEQKGEEGNRIRERGREYGTVTGRPRRCGWFDGVLAGYAVRVNSLDAVALTLVDVLDDFDHIPVASGYILRQERIQTLPADLDAFSQCVPIYDVQPGWKQSTSTVRRFEDLPANCRAYIDHLETLLGCEVALVSVGPDRSQTLHRPGGRLDAWLPPR
jgi:adenylosuccinate synthase